MKINSSNAENTTANVDATAPRIRRTVSYDEAMHLRQFVDSYESATGRTRQPPVINVQMRGRPPFRERVAETVANTAANTMISIIISFIISFLLGRAFKMNN